MSEEDRQRMVTTQLRPRGINDPRVLDAMLWTPRELFVPDELQDRAYLDRALPVGYQQTISQPYTVAWMCQLLQLQGDERVLEVGTGSGYGAAVLSRLAREVITIERIPELADAAKLRLLDLGCLNVEVVVGDGTLGWLAAAPYDAICVTAGGQELPPTLAEQLREGGRLVIPLGSKPGEQTMYRFTRQGNSMQRESLGTFAFVPLIGRFGVEE